MLVSQAVECIILTNRFRKGWHPQAGRFASPQSSSGREAVNPDDDHSDESDSQSADDS